MNYHVKIDEGVPKDNVRIELGGKVFVLQELVPPVNEVVAAAMAKAADMAAQKAEGPVLQGQLDLAVALLQQQIKGVDFHKATSYVDSQRLATMHNRLNTMQEERACDLGDLQHNRKSIMALEQLRAMDRNDISMHSTILGHLKSLGFWGRIWWVLNGFPGFITGVK